MGTIKFLDDPPFELRLAKPGRAGALLENVSVTLPVFELGPQRRVQEIQVLMTHGDARNLARQLQTAAGVADMHARGASR